MGQTPCCDMMGVKKGAWTLEEDRKLIDYIQKHGFGNWRAIPKQAGIMRCGKSCRLRWMNYLRPDLKRGNLSPDEVETIIRLHGILGNKWSTIASHLPGRTDNEIKNLWNSHLKKHSDWGRKKPVRHRPAHSPTFSTSKDSAEHIKLSGTEYSGGKDIIDDQQFVSNNLSETYQRDENLSAPDYINFLKKFLDIDEEPSVICPSYELNQDSHHFNNEERKVQQQKCLSLDQGSEDHTTPAVFCWNSPFSANQLDHEIQASFAVDSQVSYSYSPNCSSSNTLHVDTSMSLFPDSLLDLPENMWWAF